MLLTLNSTRYFVHPFNGTRRVKIRVFEQIRTSPSFRWIHSNASLKNTNKSHACSIREICLDTFKLTPPLGNTRLANKSQEINSCLPKRIHNNLITVPYLWTIRAVNSYDNVRFKASVHKCSKWMIWYTLYWYCSKMFHWDFPDLYINVRLFSLTKCASVINHIRSWNSTTVKEYF